MTRGRPGRAVVPLLGAFTALALVVAGAAITLQMKERNLRLAKEREIVLIKAENDDLQQRLNEMRDAKQTIEDTLVRAKDQLEQATAQLDRERQEKETLARSVDERQREIDRISKDLEQIRTERTTLSTQVTELKTQQQAMQQELAKVQQAKADLESKTTTAERPSVNLDPVVVSGAGAYGDPGASFSDLPLSQPKGVSSVQGQVVVVNRDYDFVVMNLGRNQGLEIGQEFQIMRGGEVLGRVKVEKLYDELAAASILPESRKDAIKEGDLLRAI